MDGLILDGKVYLGRIVNREDEYYRDYTKIGVTMLLEDYPFEPEENCNQEVFFEEEDEERVSQLIGGVLYDTKKAEFVCDLGFGNILGQFSNKLYKGKTRWFTLSENIISHTTDINPKSNDEAMNLVARYAPDKYKKYFGEVEEA